MKILENNLEDKTRKIKLSLSTIAGVLGAYTVFSSDSHNDYLLITGLSLSMAGSWFASKIFYSNTK